MTDQLEAIVSDLRIATRRDLARHARRRRRGTQTFVAVFAGLALSGGVATATGNLPQLADLFDRDDRALQTVPAGPGAQDVVLDLAGQVAGGGRAQGRVTDLGATTRSRTVPGAAVCETDGAGILSCEGVPSGTARSLEPAPTIPAGTRVYRVEPEGATGTAEQIVHVPSRRIQLVIVGEQPGGEPPAPPRGSTEQLP